MGKIKDIQVAIKFQYDNFGKKIDCIMMDEDKANSLYLEFVELYASGTNPIIDFKTRIDNLNAFMINVGLPEIVILKS